MKKEQWRVVREEFDPDTKRTKFCSLLCNVQYSLHVLGFGCFPECPEEEYDHRSLFERLEEQKQKRELEYEEAHRLSKLPVKTELSIRNMTNKCMYRYVNLLYYKQHSLLHFFGHLLWPSLGRCSLKYVLQEMSK
jgi:N-terminal domain of NEFA-interacting nuclear protein NIP30.